MKKVTIDQVIKAADPNITKEDKDQIRKAYEYASKQHKKQKRKTGEKYIQHPLHVALEIAKLHLDYKSIVAALLHDTLEDCDIPESDIKKRFGSEITELVKGVTKLRHTKDIPSRKYDIDDLRRLFFAATKDVRVLIIKLADRLHNARTIQGLEPQRQLSYAQEILNIYSPLADFIGIYYFKRELDDIAFKTINPVEYNKISRFWKKALPQRKKYLKEIIDLLSKELKNNSVKADITGREKSIYGVYKKLSRYLKEGRIKDSNEFQKIYDYYGFRILVESKIDCYKVLGIIHTLWHPILEEFDDYIANPKPNGYRSLHTTVICESNNHAEFQIRTEEMHDFNEYGPASHIAYKMSESKYARPSFGLSWLRNLFQWQKKQPADLTVEDFELSVFKENIFVLTPANEVKELPKGSTPVDFAYHIHSQIGNSCRGAKINGKISQLNTPLHTGDIVEILTEKSALYPIEDWLDFVKSPSARSKIKHALREKNKEEATIKGQKDLEQALKKGNISKSDFAKSNFKKIFDRYNIKGKQTLYRQIGYNLISPQSVIDILFPKKQSHKKQKKTHATTPVLEIEGSTDSEYTFASCCKPTYGDLIVAVSTITRGLRIHTRNCRYTKKFDNDRILRAKWL